MWSADDPRTGSESLAVTGVCAGGYVVENPALPDSLAGSFELAVRVLIQPAKAIRGKLPIVPTCKEGNQ